MRTGAQAEIGDTVKVVMELDDTPRVVTVPDDLKAAFSQHAEAKKAFAALSDSIQKEFVDWIVEAKKPETRSRRVHKSLEMLATGKRPKG